MFWIVQENVAREAKFDELIAQLERFNIPHQVVKVVPFSGELIPEPIVPAGMPVWCVGSMSMMETCRKRGWKPGVVPLDFWNVEKQISFSPWRNMMLNYDTQVVALENILDDEVPLYKNNFVRPIDDSKFIKGQIMDREELVKWVELAVGQGEVSPHTKLCLARPKRIAREARFWVVDEKIVTWSQYKLGSSVWYSESEVSERMKLCASAIVEQIYIWHIPLTTYCLDIAQIDTEGRQFRIVEINNINSSGLYDCNVQKLVMAIEEGVGKHFLG